MKRVIFSSILILLTSFAFGLPVGFRSINLGMSVSEVKASLKADSEFGYRGDRDVSLSPSDNQIIIETDGSFAPDSFLDRCWFQFSNEKLYIITITFNAEKLDHYSIFKTLSDKYGNPQSISPQKSVWKDTSVIMSLEQPLTLKYIDAVVYNEKNKSSSVDKTITEKNRENFLEGL